MISKIKEIITPIHFLNDEFIKSVYNDYIDGFSIIEIQWRIEQRSSGLIFTINQINAVIDELNQHLL